MGLNLISLESVKNIVCVGPKLNKFGQKRVPIMTHSRQPKNYAAQVGLLGPPEGK